MRHMNRADWNKCTIVQKIDHFKKKYLEKDPELIYNIERFISSERYHDTPQLLPDRIVYYESVDLDTFAEDWVSRCDEKLRPIFHYELLSDAEIKRAIEYGNDFVISHNIDYNIKNYEGILTLYGEKSIYYHEWGPYANFKDDDIHDDFFICGCTLLKGKQNLNVMCPRCKTPVQQRDFSVDKFGYFQTKHRFITGVGYRLLTTILHGPNLKEGILDYLCGKRPTKDTPIVKMRYNIAKKYKDKILYDCVEDIIAECLSAADIERKKKEIEFFLRNKDRFFLSYIPVISTAFRRMTYSSSFGVEHFEAHNDLNHTLSQMSAALMNMDMFEGTRDVYKYYYLVTKYIYKIYESIIQLSASSKHAYLRSSVMGIRQNNVVMAVLEPLARGMKEDSAVVNYRYFLALYSREIESFLINEKKLSPYKAQLILNFNTNNWKLAKELLHEYLNKNTCIVEYNRQPTIRLQSSIPLNIVGLTTAKVIYVHPTTCKKPNADHDGDAPSLKAITKEGGLNAKFYWRMGVHNYCLGHDGSFLGESMPYNDIAINIKASVPSYYGRKSSKYKRGVETVLILDGNGNKIDSEQKACTNVIDLGKEDFLSISDYKNKIESAIYDL